METSLAIAPLRILSVVSASTHWPSWLDRGSPADCEREEHNGHLTRSRLIAAQGTAATIFRYSSSENARKVSVRTFPIAPLARATWATASSFGSSEIATASYCPVTR